MLTRPSAHPGKPSLDLGNVGDKAHATTEEQVPAEHPHNMPPDSSQTPTTSTKKGSFNYDHEKGNFPMRWANITEFDAQHWTEELAYSIEFITMQVTNGDPYAGGERSSKCTKPDALLVNAHAHACVPMPISATPAPPSTTAPPSSTAPYIAFKSMPLSQPQNYNLFL